MSCNFFFFQLQKLFFHLYACSILSKNCVPFQKRFADVFKLFHKHFYRKKRTIVRNFETVNFSTHVFFTMFQPVLSTLKVTRKTTFFLSTLYSLSFFFSTCTAIGRRKGKKGVGGWGQALESKTCKIIGVSRH